MHDGQRREIMLSLLNVINVLDTIEQQNVLEGTPDPFSTGELGENLSSYMNSGRYLDDALIRTIRDHTASSIHFLQTVNNGKRT